jgi:flagellar hook-associated protein 2
MSTSSTTTSTSSLFTPLQFTGISQYSSDFQQILDRAVSVASIPLQNLSSQQSTIQQQESDLSSLGSAVSGVQSSLQALGQLGSGGALSASSSDTNVVTATSTGATSPVSYSITNVSSIATAASETSVSSYANATSTAVSSSGTMQLTLGSNTYNITLASGQNNLDGLRDAINNLGAGVTASVLTTSSGDYLSVTANSTGATRLKLTDGTSGGTDLLTSTNQGTNTNFDLNGIPISESGRTVSDVISGVTLNFNGLTSSNETVNVSLATDPSQISSALQSLVTNYNALLTAETPQISGSSSASLTGNNIVYQIRQAMSAIVQYQGGTSGMSNLANLGIEINTDGTMSFNQDTFNSLSSSQLSSALTLLGSSTSGIGGLQNTFAAITDPTSGTIAEQENQWQSTVTNLSSQMSTMTQKIQVMEQTLNQQLAAADASIAELASQQSELTSSITALNYTTYGYNSTNPSTGAA